MNYAPEVLEYLADREDFCEVILAPGAVAVQRTVDMVLAQLAGSKTYVAPDESAKAAG